MSADSIWGPRRAAKPPHEDELRLTPGQLPLQQCVSSLPGAGFHLRKPLEKGKLPENHLWGTERRPQTALPDGDLIGHADSVGCAGRANGLACVNGQRRFPQNGEFSTEETSNGMTF